MEAPPGATAFAQALSFYFGRDGNPKDFKKAKELFIAAKEQGYVRANMYLSLLDNPQGPTREERFTYDPEAEERERKREQEQKDRRKALLAEKVEEEKAKREKAQKEKMAERHKQEPSPRGVSKRVCIIGAGMSGITCAKWCLQEGHSVTVFEQAEQLGGNWVYRPEKRGRTVHSSCYENLHTNTFRDTTAFSDFPMPDHFPAHPHNSQVLEYFNLYADHFRLKEHIQLNTRVVFVEPVWDASDDTKDQAEKEAEHPPRWIVKVLKRDTTVGKGETPRCDHVVSPTCDGKRMVSSSISEDERQWTSDFESAKKSSKDLKVFEFDCVAVCNGHHWDPIPPEAIPGMDCFKGSILHSHDYRSPSEFKGKRVVIAGMGISGNDIARDLGGAGQECASVVAMSTRRFQPEWAGTSPKEAARKALSSDGLLSRLLRSFTKNDGPSTPASKGKKDESKSRMKIDNYELWPAIQSFREDGVVFECGTFFPCDAVIFCTGYRISFPFLSEKIGLNILAKPYRVGLYKHCWPVELAPSLIFLTLISTSGSIHLIGEQQAKWFAKTIAEKTCLPPKHEMQKEVDDWHNSINELKVDYRPLQVDLPSYNHMCNCMIEQYMKRDK